MVHNTYRNQDQPPYHSQGGPAKFKTCHFSSFICYITLGRNQNALFRAYFLGSLSSYLGNGFSLINNKSYTYCALAYMRYHA